jgi:hypothetical protein
MARHQFGVDVLAVRLLQHEPQTLNVGFLRKHACWVGYAILIHPNKQEVHQHHRIAIRSLIGHCDDVLVCQLAEWAF